MERQMQQVTELGKLQVGDVIYHHRVDDFVCICKVEDDSNWWYSHKGVIKQGKGSLKHLAQKVRHEIESDINASVCVICEENRVHDSWWIYIWKGKNGYACEECGPRFHYIGYYLLGKAAEYLKSVGIKVAQEKEKFGRMVLYTESITQQQEVIVKALEEQYKRRYPEFTWDFL